MSCMEFSLRDYAYRKKGPSETRQFTASYLRNLKGMPRQRRYLITHPTSLES